MPRVKREADDEAKVAPKRRGRGKARVGGDTATLLHQHGICVSRAKEVPWPRAGVAVIETLYTAAEHSCPREAAASTPQHEAPQWPPGDSAQILDAGGHICDVAWAPQTPTECGGAPQRRIACSRAGPEWLAVSALSERDAKTVVGTDGADVFGTVQIWALHAVDGADAAAPPGTLALTVRCGGGLPGKIAWRPGAASQKRIGTLAIVYSDGFEGEAVEPSPDAPTLRVAHTSVHCIAWAGDARIAAGCIDGRVAVWDLAGDVRAAPAPIACAPVHDSLVSSVSWQMLPPVDARGALQREAPPTVLMSVGWDGTESAVDIHDLYAPLRLAHTREPRYATVWSPYAGAWVADFGDASFGTVSLRTHDIAQHHALGFHGGHVTSIAASAHHPFAATGSADGSVKLTNALATGKRKAGDDGSRVMHKLFRLERRGDAYTVLEGFYPEGVWPKAGGAKPAPPSTDQWDPLVAVTAVAWSPNLGRALLLASGNAVGLVHIHWAGSD
ncbi:hypothetical protein MSPP1_002113 [Malassezia sp. CBS 17886]|nr:hypothetical protein MSPP1_002113 [Malassezia sp. CBS 17886]